MTTDRLRESLAELIGTFTLVFVGAAAALVAPVFGVLAPALAHGFILCGLIYSYGHISGAQFNPAISVALLIAGKQDASKTGLFILAQCLGAIIAAVALVAVFPQDNASVAGFLGENAYNFGQTKGFLTDDAVWTAASYEAILTFFLASAVLQAAAHGRAGALAGVAIGLTLAGCILAGGPATGASLNPARTLGPALVAGETAYLVPYFVGLFGGGIVGGLAHGYVLRPDQAVASKA